MTGAARQQQRLITDINRFVMLRDLHRTTQTATIATTENERTFAKLLEQADDRERQRRLARAADVIVADADSPARRQTGWLHHAPPGYCAIGQPQRVEET